jgi:hypothetical protein
MRVFVTDSRIHRLMVVTCRVTALGNRNASAMPDAFRNHDAHDYAAGKGQETILDSH